MENQLSNQEAKDTLQAMSGLLGLALLKEITMESIKDDETKPVTTLMTRFRYAVQIACDAIDLMDERLSIEKKDDGNDDK